MKHQRLLASLRSDARTVLVASLTCLLCLPQANAGNGQPKNRIRFSDVTEASKIDFQHSTGGSGEGYIVEGMSTGVATFDYNGDGLVDIYFLNGSALRGTQVTAPLQNRLYQNQGDWTFRDVTQEAGVGDTGYSLGVCAEDYDGDEDMDVYINNFGANVMYRNNGDQSFSDVTEELGIRNGEKVGAGVGFLDIEGDGDLDLYVSNYVNFNYDNHVPIVINGKRYQAGPQYYKPVPDTLFRNDGQGKFTDISQASGIAAVAGPGMGLICADFDNDQDTDVYVCNDGQANFLFQNDGSGVFEEVGLLFGAGCDFRGKANSSMGVDCGDYDGDQLLDLFVTNYQAEMPVLYHNLGGGLFEDATNRAGITRSLFPHVNWGTAFTDFDNDGDQDLFIACGHFDRIEEIDDRTSMKMKNYVLENVGGRFVDVTDAAFDENMTIESSRGIAVEDFDNDGHMDVLVVNSNAPPTLLQNNSGSQNKWIKIKLRQAGLNSRGIGARVWVSTGNRTQMQEMFSGRGYQSSFGATLHFGLGEVEAPVNIEVRWPDGSLQQHQAEANQMLEITRQE